MSQAFDESDGPSGSPVGYTTEPFRAAMAAPWNFGFLSLLRRIAAREPASPRVGTASRPQAEPYRLGQQPSLAFAPREIAEVARRDDRLRIRLFGLGVLGPNGPMPIHVTEIARDRKDGRQDSTLVDFLDLFHHRYLTLFYRAWAQAQAAAGLDRAADETFSLYVASLAGNDPDEALHGALPSHARLAASAHLVREARNPAGLAATLSHFFGVPVHVDEYVLHWIAVTPDEHSRLGVAGMPSVMGEGALLGEMVPDRQHKFRLRVGPLSLDQYIRLTPGGKDLPVLVDWVRAFVGHEFAWELELQVQPRSAPPARIGAPERLGWSTWLGDAQHDAPVTGMVFEPEQYLNH